MSIAASISKITEAKWYKVMMPKLYGWGASLVIIGALFKIQNWPFAGLFLTIGLTTEAVFSFFLLLRNNMKIMIGLLFILNSLTCKTPLLKSQHNN